MKGKTYEKNLPNRYSYPAIFTYEDSKEISVVFYDIELATSGENDEDALISAKEALRDRLSIMEEENIVIPAPTPLQKVYLKTNQKAVLIEIC